MTRLVRILVYALGVLLWLAVVGIAIEAIERYRMPRIEQAAKAFGDPRIAQGYARNLALVKATPAPPLPAWAPKDAPSRDEFAKRDEEGRKRLAKDREEAIILCDVGGTVQAIYPSPSSATAAELASRIQIGKPLYETFPPMERQDAVGAFQNVAATKNYQTRDYPLPLANGSLNVYEFDFLPNDGTVPTTLVFVRDSTWEVLWKKFRPHVYRGEPYVFWTNAQGFRDNEVALPKPPGVYRVVCVGGSTTAEGARNDLTYPKMLERGLRARFEKDAVEAINAGIFALTSGGECERFDDYLGLQPDLIVHYNFVNDLTYGLPDWIRPKSVWQEPVKAFKNLCRKSFFIYNHFNRLLMPSESEMKVHLRDGIIANLRTMAKRAKEAGVRMAICSFARPNVETMSQVEKDFFTYGMNTSLWGRVADIESYAWAVDLYNGLVRNLCRDSGLLYIPVAEHFQGGIDAYSDRCHVFLGAMQSKADAIADVLKEDISGSS